MSVTSEILSVLHRIHQQLADLKERQGRGPKQIRGHMASVAKFEADLQTAQGECKTLQMAADGKQLNLKSNEIRIEDLNRKLNMSSSNREYQALIDQIAADTMANSVLADEILELLEKIDMQKKFIQTAKDNLAKGKAELDKIKQAVQAQEALLLADIRRLEEELRVVEKELPADFRDAYDRATKMKGADAMAILDGDACGGCFQRLTPNLFNTLCMGRIIICSNCGRLIYRPEDRRVGETT